MQIFNCQLSGRLSIVRFSIANCQADEIVDVINDMQQAIVSSFAFKMLTIKDGLASLRYAKKSTDMADLSALFFPERS